MKRFVHTLLIALVAASLPAAAAVAQAPAQDEIVLAQVKRRATPRHRGTHVYLLRGWLDVFSTGMDDLGVKLNRNGIRASVHGHAEFPSLADAIGARHKQGIRENVVIIGHSLGANAAFQMAERLSDYNVTVPLIISYDPTASMSVSSNVRRVVNFYSSTNGWGAPIVRGPGFRGNLSNVDLSRRGEMGHTDIDKSPTLHSQSIGYIRSVGGSSRATSSRSAPKRDAKKEESAAKTTATSKDEPTDTTASISESKSSSPPAEEAKSDAATPEASDAKVGDAKTESKSMEGQSAESKSPDKQAADTKQPADAEQAADAKPSETKAADTKATETKSETAASPAPASSSSN